jgi:hypothetical protein
MKNSIFVINQIVACRIIVRSCKSHKIKRQSGDKEHFRAESGNYKFIKFYIYKLLLFH